MRSSNSRGAPSGGAVNTGRLSFQATVAGLLGVASLIALMRLVPLLGLPRVQLPYMLGYEMAGYALADDGGRMMGWITVFAAGAAFAIAYAWLIARRRPASGAGTGALFALVPWLLIGLVVFPLMGLGVFAHVRASGLAVAAATLVGCVGYGVVMGGVLKRWMGHTAQPVVTLHESAA
jgi:hypothetical protein